MRKIYLNTVLTILSMLTFVLLSCISGAQPASQEQQQRATISALETQAALGKQVQATPTFLPSNQEQQLQATIVALQTEVARSSASATTVPTSIPSPTPLLDTQPGTVLEVGQMWRVQGIELRIKGPSVVPEGIAFLSEGILVCTELKNSPPSQIVFKLGPYSDHVSAVDNRGMNLEVNTYNWRWGDQRTGWAFEEERTIILEPGETHPVLDDHNCWFVFADIGNSQVTDGIVTLKNISRIPQAQWRIKIPH